MANFADPVDLAQEVAGIASKTRDPDTAVQLVALLEQLLTRAHAFPASLAERLLAAGLHSEIGHLHTKEKVVRIKPRGWAGRVFVVRCGSSDIGWQAQGKRRPPLVSRRPRHAPDILSPAP